MFQILNNHNPSFIITISKGIAATFAEFSINSLLFNYILEKNKSNGRVLLI